MHRSAPVSPAAPAATATPTTDPVAPSPRASGAKRSSAGYRHDIDGLRALAILLVVVYHVWLGRVSGGVDVFLMISAYLLTASLVRRTQRGEPLRLGRHWLHRFSRLLPAAVVTLIGVLAMTYLVYPESSWPQMWRETWTSLFYVQNWELASSEVDYYARQLDTASPLQHFWSLSVQGQVFILWPILIGVTVWLTRRRAHRLVPALIAVFATVFVFSLTYSIIVTSGDQSFAYFNTWARLWEFAAGSLVALLLPYLRLPRIVRALLGWTGVAGIVLCGIVLDVQGGFPGYLALWPVVCTALVIASGTTRTRGGPATVLESRPLLALGQHAYALYLVHWPILIAWMVLRDRQSVGLVGGLGIILVSIMVASLLSRDLEQPLRRFATSAGPRWRELVVVAASVLLVAGSLAGWQSRHDTRTASYDPNDPQLYPGAAFLAAPEEFTADHVPLIPAATEFDGEWMRLGSDCHGVWIPHDPLLVDHCRRRDGSDPNAPTVMIIGDSHAQQLAEPLVMMAQTEGWGLVSLLIGGCSLGYGEITVGALEPAFCEDWRRAAVDYAIQTQPDAVYLVTTKTMAHTAERMVIGVDQVIDELLAAGIDVIGVRDNPRFSFDMYDCVVNGPHACVVPRDHILAPAHPATGLDERIIEVDFTPWLCPGGRCHGVIGNIAVYFDDNHITRSYGRTLAPMFAQQIDEQRDRISWMD